MRTVGFALIYLILFVFTTSIRAQDNAKSGRPTPTPAGSESRYLKTKELRIHYLEWNKAGDQTIILLHGLYDTARTWDTLAALLAERGFRVVAPDRRGSGRTSKPQSGYEIKTLSNDVLDIVSTLELGNATIVGHSAGASVALTAASIKPDAFRSVVLVDGGFWPTIVSGSHAVSRPPGCDREGPRCERESAIEKGNRDYDADSLYSKVSLPTLLLMATPDYAEAQPLPADFKDAKKHVETVANDKLTHGKAVFINGSGHWIQNDQPRKLAEVIEKFVIETDIKIRP